eukprot:g734.t1
MGGTKKKVGKDRLDKYYQLAKDQGYRARSAFKLVQLCKKTDFLSNARTCVDLCGAPGGWSQVAVKNMPRGSKVLCIDLCPIKPIPGVTGIQCDITTPKCRQLIRKELDGRMCEVVLNDGAPNVGSSWSHDAYVQNELVLHATKLAADILKPNGTFVTKVFRSQDYTSLLWVFEQLFHKVEATKPQASRNVSAEIFVICHGYKGLKADPKYFDPKWVFMEAVDAAEQSKKSQASLVDLLKYQTKKHRGGYDPGDDMRTCSLLDFVKALSPALILTTHHKLLFKDDENLKISDELREYCEDLKVLGKGELSKLLKWRILTKRNYEKERKASAARTGDADADEEKKKAAPKSGSPKAAVDAAESEDEIDKEAEKSPGAGDEKVDEKLVGKDAELQALIDEEKRNDKRDNKKLRELKKKFEWRKKMSMGMRYSGIQHDAELFQKAPRGNAFSEFAEGAGGQDDTDDEMDMGIDQGIGGAEEKHAAAAGHGSDEEDDDDPELAELNRLADMEAEQIFLSREKKNKQSAATKGRELKQKKETRRQQKYKEWGAEMDRFNHEIDEEAAKQHQERNRAESEDDGDSSDDDSDADEEEIVGSGKPNLTSNILSDDDEETGAAAGNARGNAVESDEDMGPRDDANDSDEDEEAGNAKDAVRAQRWFSQDLFSSLQSRLASGATTASATAGTGASMKKAARKEQQRIAVSRNSRNSDTDSDADQEIDALSDADLPHIPLCDKKKRQLRKRREKEKEAAKTALNFGGSLKRGVNIAPGEDDALKINGGDAGGAAADDKTMFDVVERNHFDDEMDNILLPGQEAQKKDDRPEHLKPPTDKKELAAVQAIGSLMIRKKSRMALLDSAYNRYAWDDDGLDLPEWFVEEEEKYNKPELPVTKELMDQYRAKMKEINQRPIRKVAEANARNKKRLQQRMDKVRKQAKILAADTDMSAGAKARNMEKMLRKATKEGSKKQAYMAVRKSGGSRNVTKGKPTAGAKAKVVDKRLKTDKRGAKKAAKKASKGKHKGNRARKVVKKGGGGGKKAGKGGGKKK